MPGVEIAASPKPAVKSRKALPRWTNIAPENEVVHIAFPENGSHYSASEPAATTPALPLTPPGTGHEGTSIQNASGIQKGPSSRSVNSINDPITPAKHSHPPTPEITPPRTTPSTYRPGISQFGHASLSSRAESFQTASVMISDNEPVAPHHSTQSLHCQERCRRRTRKPPQSSSRSSSSDASLTDDASTLVRSNETLRPLRFEPSDGNNDGNRSEGSDTECRGSAPVRGDLRPQPGQEDLPPIRGRTLCERVKDADCSMANLSLEQFRETIGWPAAEEESRRFSGVSTSSTIEVFIIDAPQPANRILRHTEKRSSLRSASSSLTKSERTSLDSNSDLQHRLVHKVARITEQNRKSIASEISIPAGHTAAGINQSFEIVPVVVIPERRSSLQFSTTSVSRNPSRPGSRQSSQRAPSVRKCRPPSLDLAHQRKRRLSDSIAVPSQERGSRGRNLGPPVIPPRSSSLPAPTKNGNARATSATSKSPRKNTLANHEMERGHVEHFTVELANQALSPSYREAADVPETQSIWIGVEDMAHLRPPSILFTPASIPSSSPGLVEIKEARTVAFFPHNNESLLLVDQPVRSAPQPRAFSTHHREYLDNPRTPENALLQNPNQVGSPLRNPRPPPKSPVQHANSGIRMRGTDQELRAADGGPRPNGNTPRRFDSLRRRRGIRLRSDSFDRFVRSLSVTSAKNRKAGRDIDSRLHPFWRPRRFWDDSPDSEEFPGREKAADPEPDQIISNSLGMPQPRVIFDGPSLARCSPEMKGPLHSRRLRSQRSLVGSTMFSPEALRSQTSLHQRRILSLSWWRLRLRSGPVRNLRKRLRRTLQEREEGRREARRQKLKQKIGEAVLVGSSLQARDLARQP